MDYKIYKQDSYWVIESERAISIEDWCYDVTTDTFVIAVKHNKGGDYVVINREFEIVQTITEEQGLNRKFVLAPDESSKYIKWENQVNQKRCVRLVLNLSFLCADW